MSTIEKSPRLPIDPEFAARYAFPFDTFQLEAMEHVRSSSSVMVAAPTSAGKTVVAEYALWRTLGLGKRAVYTTPIKALSNQKRRDLEAMFPGQVGLLTGDRSENRAAAILVMTTEVLRNMLLEDPDALTEVTCVVFDEVHYLADRERGTIWEESIITCLPHIQLVCLSATIANAEEVADWISQTHRSIALVCHDERPVPLEHYAFTSGALRLIWDARGKRLQRVPQPELRRRKRTIFAQPEDVLAALDKADLLPAIWFAFTRQGVEDDAERCAEARPPVSGVRADAIESSIAWTLSSIPPEDRSLPQISRLISMLRHGVGFHHAGLLPPCKELVEDLFLRGFLDIICATDTLSVGINMPARTVVISNVARPVGGLLTANDFSQLTGRAGRRGIDEQGAVVILPSALHDFERSYAMLTGELEPVRSSFTLRYSTLLSLFEKKGAEDRLAALVRSSLRQFQLYGDAREAEAGLLSLEAKLALLPPIPELDGREEELAEYLEIQSRLTSAERGSARADGRHPGKMDRGRAARRQRARRSEIDGLRRLLRMHPMHRLAHDQAFQTAAGNRIALLMQRNRLVRAIEEARRERDRDAERTARAVSSVLHQLGYVDRRGVTRKAAGLREMVAPGGIVLSEMYHEGLLDELAPAGLAEVLSWFACDVDRRRWNRFQLPGHLRHVRSAADSLFGHISALEEREGIRLAQGPSRWFWGVALAWSGGEPIDAIVPYIESGEGDIVSFLNKTIDLLDQLRSLFAVYGDTKLISRADEASVLLCRGLVAMIRGDSQLSIKLDGQTAPSLEATRSI